MTHQAREQHDYHHWANQRVFAHLKQLPETVYSQEITSGFATIASLIVHIYQTDGMWLSVMAGDSMDETYRKIQELQKKAKDQSLAAVEQRYHAVAEDYRQFLENLKNPDKPITIEHPRYGKLDVSVTDMVKHVVNHGTYHRGNITTLLRQLGQKGVPTDYIFYLYERKKK